MLPSTSSTLKYFKWPTWSQILRPKRKYVLQANYIGHEEDENEDVQNDREVFDNEELGFP